MNKMLIAVFANEKRAEAGLKALQQLHAAGDLTVYATGLMEKDAMGSISISKAMDPGSTGALTGLAVGSLIGLLGGPAGMALGALTGTAAGTLRDFWVAGVGLDFVEEAEVHLERGTVALVAEIEEERVAPLDAALQALGARVFRRRRSEVAEALFEQDIAAFKAEIRALETEAALAGGAARTTLEEKLGLLRSGLERAVLRARQRVDALSQEAQAKTASLKRQLSQASEEASSRIEERVTRVTSAYHARGEKLSRAWHLTKDALAF
jgi:uncharacterized membrane protein